ncbi:MAG: YceI family protein [Bacteroidota bacterium]
MIKRIAVAALWLVSFSMQAQGFKVNAKGNQIFNFEDKAGRNQITFFSTTPLEDINGTVNGISGYLSFDVSSFAKTAKGKILVKVASMNTGIELRNSHLKGANWLNEKKFPEITFELKSVEAVKQSADNKLDFRVKGNFSLHGVTTEITADAEVVYLDENEQTQKRAPGDLLGVKTKFKIKLSDYDIDNAVIGSKVSEDIEVTVNIVGSNK